jgi:hypothetical protein
MEIIEEANGIIAGYLSQGFKLTLRQLFYQFVARALLLNTISNYKLLGRTLRNARDGGLVDWDAIEDRTREVNNHSSWESPSDIIAAAADSFRVDPWADQKYRPEVWIEKDALLGVIEGVCTEYRVPYFAHRGNNSQTLQHEGGKRFARRLTKARFRSSSILPIMIRTAST